MNSTTEKGLPTRGQAGGSDRIVRDWNIFILFHCLPPFLPQGGANHSRRHRGFHTYGIKILFYLAVGGKHKISMSQQKRP